MILLSRVRRNGTVDLVIVLTEENIERLMCYDPAEVILPNLPLEISTGCLNTIGVAFATAEEHRHIEQMSQSDPLWKEKALAIVTRGFEYRPDLGDHDFGPTVLGKPTEGPKQ